MSTTTSDKFVRDMLLKGRTVDFVADASGYPREAVAEVLQQIIQERGQANGASTLQTPAPVETRPNPAANASKIDGETPGSVTQGDTFPESQAKPSGHADLPEMREQARKIVQPRPEFNARTTNAVELLVRAQSMDDRRVQGALGRARKAMTDLAEQVTRYDEANGARERLAELEEEMRALKAQLRGGKTGSKSTPPPPYSGEPLECRKGCGRVSPNPQGRSAHERFCKHDAGAVA